MADLYIGLNRGQSGMSGADFTIGSSSGSTDVELRIDTSKSLNRIDVHLMAEAIARLVNNQGAVDLTPTDFAARV